MFVNVALKGRLFELMFHFYDSTQPPVPSDERYSATLMLPAKSESRGVALIQM